MLSCGVQVLLWSLLVLVIVVGVMIWIGVYLYNSANAFNILLDRFLSSFEDVDTYCKKLPPITYREGVYVPYLNGSYEQKLAIALIDVCFAVSNANCPQALPLPNPPGFTQQLRLEGNDPISGDKVMFAYIFSNPTTRQACFGFSATFFNYQWNSDFQYQQVPPTTLNGYASGMLVHKGFYDIYLVVQKQLWAWWVANGANYDTLYITGHSSAGSVSTLCAFDFANVFAGRANARNSRTGAAALAQIPIHYSFAAPSVCNPTMAAAFNTKVPTSCRVNNTSDIVLMLPLPALGSDIYEQTGGNVPFTASMTNIRDDHIAAYFLYMPTCPEVAGCYTGA